MAPAARAHREVPAHRRARWTCPKGAGGPGAGAGPATITAVNGNTLTLRYANGTTQHMTLVSDAAVARVVAASPSDLKAGEKVSAQVTTNADGSKTVSSIEIEPS